MPDPHDHDQTRWQKSVVLFTRESSVIMPALFIGSLVAGLVQVAVPPPCFWASAATHSGRSWR